MALCEFSKLLRSEFNAARSLLQENFGDPNWRLYALEHLGNCLSRPPRVSRLEV